MCENDRVMGRPPVRRNVVVKDMEGTIMTKLTTCSLMLMVTLVAGSCRGMETSGPLSGQSIVSQVSPAVSTPDPQGTLSPDHSSGRAVIGHLKTRDKVITILTGRGGPLYTVKTADGKVLAEQLPEHELYAKFPDLKEVVDRGLAGNDARLVRPDRAGAIGIHLQPTVQ
jgi:hypothetical protein